MHDYKAVRSGLDISKSIAFYLEMSDPAAFRLGDRAGSVKAINDILQGRSERSVESLLSELEQKGGSYYAGEIAVVRQNIQDFLHQKELLYRSCGKSRDTEYTAPPHIGRRPMRVINQELFDREVKKGFSPGFFQNAYFDQVTFYCLPDETDCSYSVFMNCSFAVCGIRDVSFDCTSIYDSEFYSSILSGPSFLLASIAHTHFHDCTLSHVNFNRAKMKSCNIIDCSLDHINFNCITMDGCTFGRVKSKEIWNLDRAAITQGGATHEECQRNRNAIFHALGAEQEVS